jgi:hypothetical protein
VNFKFLPEDVFVAKELSILLLVATVIGEWVSVSCHGWQCCVYFDVWFLSLRSVYYFRSQMDPGGELSTVILLFLYHN